MKLLFQLSLRNLLRHRRRNGMLLLAIAVAVAGVNGTNTLLRGYQYDMLDSAVSNLIGHVKVHAPGYRDDPNIQKGFLLDGSDKRVLIGRELARQLETQVGRRLVIITQGADGLNRERGYRIAGTFDADGTGLEKAFVFVGLTRLQKLLDSQAVTEVSIRLTDERFRESAKQTIENNFADLEVMDWQDLEPQLAQMYMFADATLFIWFLLMMGALTFGLVNSLIAAVMERIKELGMLRALGMQKRTVVLQVVLESGIMMGLGVLVGTVFSWLIFYFIKDGIDLSAWAEGAEMVGVSTLLVPIMLPSDLVLVAGMSMVLGLVASLYPAWRVVRIRPLDALRG